MAKERQFQTSGTAASKNRRCSSRYHASPGRQHPSWAQKSSVSFTGEAAVTFLGYIADHLDSKLTLERLAGISGFKTDYFGKLFRREIGVGVSEYIRSRRIERACYELEHADKSIDEIAQETGFFDTSYFIKTFKKYCGVTPLHFRRNSRLAPREKQDR